LNFLENAADKEKKMNKPKAGLLPLYLELYDKSSPEARPKIEAFYREIAGRLRRAGIDVEEVPVCRLAEEFSAAVMRFEQEKADAVITVHLAYSPSLESSEALKNTKLPVIILDTTPDYSFDHRADPDLIMYNHGIHGVQDMCNLLIRNNKTFAIHAGHIDRSDVVDRVVKSVKAAKVCQELKNARVGIIGKPFKGMGDFGLPFDEMKRDLGITVEEYDFKEGEAFIASIGKEDIQAEYEKDLGRFDIDKNLSRECYDLSARTALGIRRWVMEKNLSAFTVNFNEASRKNGGLPVMPFTECSSAMSGGLGYAGEGDVLTAAFVGALLSVYPETTFTEMFCPDWEHGSVFLSHMGEYNYRVASDKPFLTEKPFPFTDAENPTVAYSTLKSGRAVLANLAPFGASRYRLTIVPGEMLKLGGENKLALTVNGWFKPEADLSRLLETYSEYGATHHSVLVYGDKSGELGLIGKYAGWETHIIGR
jgi:L-arabinose isomerase